MPEPMNWRPEPWYERHRDDLCLTAAATLMGLLLIGLGTVLGWIWRFTWWALAPFR